MHPLDPKVASGRRGLPLPVLAVFILAITLSPLWGGTAWAIPTTTDQPDMVYGEDEEEAGGNSVPLTLESASIQPGDQQVPRLPLIQLDFNKNVVSISVAQNNIQCFHLTDSQGEPLSIDLIFPDDQLQQEVKRCVFIRPQEPLDADANYTLYIDNTLLAKNGSYIDQAYAIPFSTGTELEGEENALLESLGDLLLLYESQLPPGDHSQPGAGLESTDQDLASHRDGGEAGRNGVALFAALDLDTLSRIIALAAVVGLLLLTLLLLVRNRRGKRPNRSA